MNSALSDSDALGFPGNLSLGADDARAIVAVFVFLAAAFAFYYLWRRVRQLNRLNQAIKLHAEEAIDGLDPAADRDGALDHRMKRDVWTN
jgi:hypothetical protein